jgi:putative transferase (TIGR04331 family)
MKLPNLVVVPIEKLWSKNKNNVLLGEWCLPIHKKHNNLKYSKLISSSHRWNEFKNFKKDFLYLESLSDKILVQLAKKLNKHHQKNFDLIFWKIFLKSWLTNYIQIIFDRWLHTEKLKNKKFVFNKFDFNHVDLADNTKDFKFLAKEHLWNYELFSKIINFRYSKKVHIKKDRKKINLESRYWIYKNSKIKKIFLKFTQILNFLLYQKSKTFLFDTYLSRIDNLTLSLKLRSFGIPFIYVGEKYSKKNEILRKKILNNFNKPKNDFEKFLLQNLKNYLPKIFFEDFKKKIRLIKSYNWPDNPKIILTSHGINNDMFNIYLALCKLKKTKLIFLQHGGGYFQFNFSSNELFEKEISDYYIGWGKQNSFGKKHINYGINKPLGNIKYERNKAKKLTIILKQGEIYNQRLLSNKRIFLHKKYINDILNIICKINKVIKNKIILRTHSKHNFGEYYFFKKNNLTKNIEIDDGNKDIKKIYQDSKIVFHTYAITGYLETMATNIPTVVYNDNSKYPLNKATLKNLMILKKAKIFFDDYEEAVHHINSVWNNVDEWWNNDYVKKARYNYGKLYGHYNSSYVSNIYKFIKRLI